MFPLLFRLWFSFILGLNFIFLCFKLIIIHYHTPKQRKIKFKPRINLNHNIYIVNPNEISNHFTIKKNFCCKRCKDNIFFFIFCMKAHLVFHFCLYKKEVFMNRWNFRMLYPLVAIVIQPNPSSPSIKYLQILQTYFGTLLWEITVGTLVSRHPQDTKKDVCNWSWPLTGM